MDNLAKLPRYWPIIFVVGKLKKVHNNFNLQKFIYLAKVEGKIPIKYIFTKHNYGPYCSQIKIDAKKLNNRDIISMYDDGIGWIFEITDNGNKEFNRIESILPEKYKLNFEAILNNFKNFSRYGLQNYIYKKHIRSLDKNEEIKKSLICNINNLMEDFSKFLPSRNRVLIEGSLDYCLCMLKKEKLTDTVRKDELLQAVSAYVVSCSRILDLVEKDKNLLSGMNLSNLEEDFEYIQSMAGEYNILPHIEEEAFLEMYGI